MNYLLGLVCSHRVIFIITILAIYFVMASYIMLYYFVLLFYVRKQDVAVYICFHNFFADIMVEHLDNSWR